MAIPFSTTGMDNGNWANANNGSTITSAPTNGSTGTGITFANWSGQFSETTPRATSTYGIGVAMGSTNEVNTLLETFFGIIGTNATVTFTNSNGATDVFQLQGDDTIRDYNQNNFENDLGGGSGDLTAQNWWNNGQDGQRLDVQTFILPTSWDGTTLVSMSVSAPSGSENPTPDDLLSAVQVVVTTPDAGGPPPSATPEPSSLALLGTSVLGMAGAVRRRMRAGR